MLFITTEGVGEFNCQLFSFKSGRDKLNVRKQNIFPLSYTVMSQNCLYAYEIHSYCFPPHL